MIFSRTRRRCDSKSIFRAFAWLEEFPTVLCYRAIVFYFGSDCSSGITPPLRAQFSAGQWTDTKAAWSTHWHSLDIN
ncbi:MAG: hypothetical protein DHS20C12_03210 [Pseudohongiella sp.]|nr:MAG: hypothetical protein DHS20C12_03210 [Pseudohongiella sp.]